jgi:hypothetical protein
MEPNFKLVFNQIFGLSETPNESLPFFLFKPANSSLPYDFAQLDLFFFLGKLELSLNQLSPQYFLFKIKVGQNL